MVMQVVDPENQIKIFKLLNLLLTMHNLVYII